MLISPEVLLRGRILRDHGPEDRSTARMISKAMVNRKDESSSPREEISPFSFFSDKEDLRKKLALNLRQRQ